MTALDDYLASAECREEVNRLTIPGWDVSEVPPALNALCEQLREAQADPYKGQWKRKFMHAEAERDALRAENERLATELEEARGMLRLALKELGPLGLIGADGRRHYSTENWRQLLRARYREGAK